MDGPFYSSNRSYPSRYRYHYSPPSAGESSVQPTVMPARKKVVSIPVLYVGSDQNRSDSAVKIQRLFRGFLVRKSVKKIAAIRREVNEIEKRISTVETVELIRRDSKERVKINETLMNLLLKLDSVCGVDSGVRDCRKAVIKKAIALQETVDAIAAAGVTAVPADAVSSEPEKEDVDQMLETEDASPEVKGVTTGDSAIDNCDCAKNAIVDEKLELVSDAQSIPAVDDSRVQESVSVPKSDEAEPMREKESLGLLAPEVDHDATASSESECADPHTESHGDSSASPEGMMERDIGDDGDSLGMMHRDVGDGGDSLGNQEENAMDIGEQKKDSGGEVLGDHHDGGEGKGEKGRSGELLERMMEDNEKMMGMMKELFRRNAMQMRLLGSLSQRVEQLEKAFVCDKLRRTKRRNAAGSVVDCSESTLDLRKCGKKR